MSGFWKGRKVLVTGHSGFKGGWLSLWLHAAGAKVYGYSLPAPSEPSFYVAARIAESVEGTMGDVRDARSFEEFVRQTEPEVAFHLAAQPLVRVSYIDPVETYSVNVIGTAVVLEVLRRVGCCRSVVVVTSDKCYENRGWVWGYRESDAIGGYDPYSSSKGCAELVTSAFRSSFFNLAKFAEHRVAVASARAGNVIGGGDWAADRLVPDIVQAISRGHPVRLRNPQATRPWQHVLEPLSAYLRLAEKLYFDGPRFSESWNFGPSLDDAVSVKELVEQVCACWGEGASWVYERGDQPHEADYLALDCSKAARLLGWKPRLDLNLSIGWTVEWYKHFMDNKDVHQLSLEQIGRYEMLEAR